MKGRGFWTLVLGFVMGVALAGKPVDTAPSAPSAAPVEPAPAPAIALSHRARHLMEALAKGDAEALRSAQLEVEVLRRTYSTLDVTPLVEAMAVWARQQGLSGRPDLGLDALRAVERWATDDSILLGTRITLMRQKGLGGWFWSLPELLQLTRHRLENPAHRWLWLTQHLGMLRLSATLLLWGWALTMGLRYRNVLRHLWEGPLKRLGLPPILAAVVGAVILTGPVLLGLDPMVAAVLWLFLLGPFLLVSEVKATVFILVLQLIHPLLGAAEPWSAREPQPSVLRLQLQPQVHPMSPASLRLLPETDQAFLAGWTQIQRQDWAAAEVTFRSLVGRHPDQAEVLNNLGMAEFQLGDAKRADETFNLALVAAPRMETLLNQSIIAFNSLDTALGSSKQDAAQALSPQAYARLISLNDAGKDARTYPIPLPDTPQRIQALMEAAGVGTTLGVAHLQTPPFLFALLLPLLGTLGFLIRVRGSVRMAHPGQCVRCGDAFHTTDSSDPEICSKCNHLFVLRDGLHTENRMKKIEEVAGHQRATRWIHRTLILLLPGCDHAFLGETSLALSEFLPLCLAVAMVLATGRTVRYPGEILADPTSTWLAVGVALMGLLYLRSWLKLVLRRA